MTKADKHPVAVRLRELREGARLSLTKLSEQSGEAAPVIGSYERGERKFHPDRMDNMLRPFGYRLGVVPLDSSAGSAPMMTDDEIVKMLFRLAQELESRKR